jgi:hypothetical protein
LDNKELTKALGKLGNIVVKHLWFSMFPQMCPCLPTRGNIVAETKFASREAKMFPSLANSETFDVSLCFSLMFPSVCPLWETWRNIGRKHRELTRPDRSNCWMKHKTFGLRTYLTGKFG